MSKMKNNALENAIDYAQKGWKVFPIQAGTKDQPLCKWSKSATSDPKKIKEWSEFYPDCNWGLATGPSNLLIIDVDNKPDEKGEDTLFDLEFDSCDLPNNTITVNTPSGGKHIYLEGTGPSTVRELGPGLDTRGEGGYVLIPGSVIEKELENGNKHRTAYSLKNGCRNIAKCPSWVIKKLSTKKIREKKRDISEEEVEWDSPVNIVRASEYLSNVSPAIEGEGGDKHTFSVACQLWDYAISQEKALDLMLKYFNERCEPPWTAPDLETKIKNAYQYAKNNPGTKTPEMAFKKKAQEEATSTKFEPIDEEIEKVSKPVQTIFDCEDLQHVSAIKMGLTEPPPRKWVLEGPGGLSQNIVGIIAGQGGCGKTLLAMQLACSIASGVDCLHGSPWDFSTQGRVIMALAEDSIDEIERRMYRIRQSMENPKALDLSQLYIFPRSQGLASLIQKDAGGNIQRSPAFYKLKKYVADTQPALLVLDSFSLMCGEGETDNADAAKIINIISEFCEAGWGTTVLLLHHVNKVSQSGKNQASKKKSVNQILYEALSPEAVRGSSAIINNTRWVMTMTRAPEAIRDQVMYEGNNLIAGAVRKTNQSAPLEEVWFGNEDGMLRRHYATDVTKLQDSTLMDQIIDMIRQEPMSRKEFETNRRSDLGLTQKRAKELITRLKEEGRLTSEGGSNRQKSVLVIIE